MYQVRKRSGEAAAFDIQKICAAMEKAFEAQHRNAHPGVIDLLALRVTADFEPKIRDGFIFVEDIQDSVEKVLSDAGYALSLIHIYPNSLARGEEVMCSRYQFLPGSSNLLQTIAARAGGWSGGEVSPGADAPVLVAEGAKIRVCLQNWGIPVINGKRAINARAETVCERPLFQASILHHRCVVPTTGFYEWDGQKHRYLFRLAQQPAVYLAGLYTEEGQIRHFAVLTTALNASVRDIHELSLIHI